MLAEALTFHFFACAFGDREGLGSQVRQAGQSSLRATGSTERPLDEGCRYDGSSANRLVKSIFVIIDVCKVGFRLSAYRLIQQLARNA
jgi:hypothetical protein